MPSFVRPGLRKGRKKGVASRDVVTACQGRGGALCGGGSGVDIVLCRNRKREA